MIRTLFRYLHPISHIYTLHRPTFLVIQSNYHDRLYQSQTNIWDLTILFTIDCLQFYLQYYCAVIPCNIHLIVFTRLLTPEVGLFTGKSPLKQYLVRKGSHGLTRGWMSS